MTLENVRCPGFSGMEYLLRRFWLHLSFLRDHQLPLACSHAFAAFWLSLADSRHVQELL